MALSKSSSSKSSNSGNLDQDPLRRRVRREGYGALGSSFMFLCFVTAALLVVVQSRVADPAAQQAVQPTANPAGAESAAGQPSGARSPNAGSWEPNILANPVSATPPPLHPGLADMLSASLQPVALIYQPKLVVNLRARQVTLYQNDEPQAHYPIAVGREGWETPTGEFKVLNLRENPVWRNPITGEVVAEPADNPLGSRWIGFWTDGKHQIGFHGTDQVELIGQAVSHGCIRMRDADIQALYPLVAVGTPVIVEP